MNFIKSNKNKRNNNIIRKKLIKISKELQNQESIDIENIDNSSILEYKDNRDSINKENSKRKLI